jgi:epoxide hydrolase-like predicted phosphatase
MVKIKTGIRAIIFDVGGVLSLGKYNRKGYREHHLMGVHHYMADALHIDIDTWFDAIDSVYGKSIEGLVSRRKTLATMASNLEISVLKLKKLFAIAYKRHFKRNKELYKIAYELKENGYRVGILSDQWYLSEDALILRKDFAGFSPVIVSCDVGMRKPSLKIYQLLIRKLKLKPHEILFIDNRDWNIKPANKLGIKTILFRDNKQLVKDMIAKGILFNRNN